MDPLAQCVTEVDLDQAVFPYLCRQVAAHSTGMGVQGHSGEQTRPVAGGRSGRSSGECLLPGSRACWSWGSHRWGFLGDCRAQRSQLGVKVAMKFGMHIHGLPTMTPLFKLSITIKINIYTSLQEIKQADWHEMC